MNRTHFIEAAQERGWVLFSSTPEGLTFRCARMGCEHARFVSQERVESGRTLAACQWEHRPGANRYAVPSYSEMVYLLREARWRMGLSQEELGACIGGADGHVNKLEVGDRRATMPTLLEWAQALGFDVVLMPAPLPKATLRAIERRVYQPRLSRAREAPSRRRVPAGTR